MSGVDVFQPLTPRRVHSLGGAVLAIWLSGLTVLVQASQAAQPAQPVAATEDSPPGPTAAGMYVGRSPAATVVEDVVLGPDGLLRGRVLDESGEFALGKVAGLRVRLLRERRTMAVTTTNYRGEFALQNLPQGPYTAVVDGCGTPGWRSCRVWTAHTAPPHARSEVRVPIGAAVVRGQYPSPFPIMSLRQAAIVTGIAGGALAAPVIYHNTRTDNRVPSSP